jgi:hypothetical protein
VAAAEKPQYSGTALLSPLPSCDYGGGIQDEIFFVVSTHRQKTLQSELFVETSRSIILLFYSFASPSLAQ